MKALADKNNLRQMGAYTVYPNKEGDDGEYAIWHNDVHGVGGVVAGVRDVLQGKTKLARVGSSCPSKANYRLPCGGRGRHHRQGKHRVRAWRLGSAGGDRQDDPMGANSYALVNGGGPDSLDDAIVAATLITHLLGKMNETHSHIWRVEV